MDRKCNFQSVGKILNWTVVPCFNPDCKSIKETPGCWDGLFGEQSRPNLSTRLQTAADPVHTHGVFLCHVEPNHRHYSPHFSSEVQDGYENSAFLLLLGNGIYIFQFSSQSRFIQRSPFQTRLEENLFLLPRSPGEKRSGYRYYFGTP